MYEAANEKYWVKWWRRIEIKETTRTMKTINFNRQWNLDGRTQSGIQSRSRNNLICECFWRPKSCRMFSLLFEGWRNNFWYWSKIYHLNERTWYGSESRKSDCKQRLKLYFNHPSQSRTRLSFDQWKCH